MTMRREARKHDTVAVQRHEAAREDLGLFRSGQRVLTVDGPGRVEAVHDGPFPGSEDYEVVLDGGLGGGRYTASQITDVLPTTASVEHTAAEDYEELREVLFTRPDPASLIYTASLDPALPTENVSDRLPGDSVLGSHASLFASDASAGGSDGSNLVGSQLEATATYEPSEVRYDSTPPLVSVAHIVSDRPQYEVCHEVHAGVDVAGVAHVHLAGLSDEMPVGPAVSLHHAWMEGSGVGTVPEVAVAQASRGSRPEPAICVACAFDFAPETVLDRLPGATAADLVGAADHVCSLATHWYPELGTLLYDRPDPAKMVYTASLQAQAEGDGGGDGGSAPGDSSDGGEGHWSPGEYNESQYHRRDDLDGADMQSTGSWDEDDHDYEDHDGESELAAPQRNYSHDMSRFCGPDCQDDFVNGLGSSPMSSAGTCVSCGSQLPRLEHAQVGQGAEHSTGGNQHPDEDYQGHPGHSVASPAEHDNREYYRQLQPKPVPMHTLSSLPSIEAAADSDDLEDPDKVYLRFGHWPEDERSGNNVTGFKEEGVSTYELNHRGEPKDPDPDFSRGHEHDSSCEPDCDLDWDNDDYGNDTREEMDSRVNRAEWNRRNGRDLPGETGHLVKGKFVGFGHDAEPLLNNVRRVGDWIDHRHHFFPHAEPHHLARSEDDEDYEPPAEAPAHHKTSHLTMGPQPEGGMELLQHLMEHHGYSAGQLASLPPSGQHDELQGEHYLEHSEDPDGVGGEWGRGETGEGTAHSHKGNAVDNLFPASQQFDVSGGAPQGHYLSMLVTAAREDPEFRFHVTAAWSDVRAKAKRIRSEGGVQITHASDGMVVGNVKGDHNVYETGLQRLPGRRQSVASYSCGCKWGAYHWGAEDDLSRFAGRMCSHALALQYEAASRGMFGKDVSVDDTRPRWVPKRVVVKYDIDEGANVRARASLLVPEQAPLVVALAGLIDQPEVLRRTEAAVNDLFGDSTGQVEPSVQPVLGPTSPPNLGENPATAGPLATDQPSNWGSIEHDRIFPRMSAQQHEAILPALIPAARVLAPMVLDTLFSGDKKKDEDDEPDGAEATLHDEPEPALPATDGSLWDVEVASGDSLASAEDDALSPENMSMQTQGSRSVEEIVADFQRSAGAQVLMNGKTATSFSAAERQELINESPGTQASNTDRLDIAGTHYALIEDEGGEDEDSWMA